MSEEGKLTPEEIVVSNLIVDMVNAFCALEQYHPSDVPDIVFHTHALQNILMSRVAVRTNPEMYPKRSHT